MNGWQKFWMGVDEARLTVRFFMMAKLALLGTYVWYVTSGLFAIIDMAMEQNGTANWENLAAILTAVTAFVTVTVPVLSKMYMEAWHDYRNSDSPLHDLKEST